MADEKIFNGLLYNYAIDDIIETSDDTAKTTSRKLRFNKIKTLLGKEADSKSLFINIHPAIPKALEEEGAADNIPFSEESRMGGYGKTFHLKKYMAFIQEEYFKNSDVDLTLIELDEQYITKEAILKKIIKHLAAIEKYYSNSDTFVTLQGDVNKETENKNVDPSYKANLLFLEAVKKYQRNDENKFFLFIDAFDAQYLGSKYSEIRVWLETALLPLLLEKLNITIIVAGREKVKLLENEDDKKDYKTYAISLDLLDNELANNQIRNFEEKNEKRVVTPVVWKEVFEGKNIENILILTEGKPLLIDLLCNILYVECKRVDSTEGVASDKTIQKIKEILEAPQNNSHALQDFFQLQLEGIEETENYLKMQENLVKRLKLSIEKRNSLERFLKGSLELDKLIGILEMPTTNIKVLKTFFSKIRDTQKQEELIAILNRFTDNSNNFKAFLIDKLYKSEEKVIYYRRSIATAIQLLTIARHGLSYKQYALLTCKLNEKYDKTPEDYEDDVKDFFEEVFTSDQHDLKAITNNSKEGRSFVKNRYSDKGEPIRLLHDELLEMFWTHWYNVQDTDFSYRRNHYEKLLYVIESDMKKLYPQKDTSDEYAKLLLEYLEYSLMHKGKESETKAINRLLFEYTSYLDRHTNLSSHILEKGSKYYHYKKAKRDKIDATTLNYKSDFNLLFKLRFREAEFALTKRSGDWKKRIESIIQELEDVLNKSDKVELSLNNKLGLEGRLLNIKGEYVCWDKNNWEKGREHIEKAKNLLYQTGDSHGVAWSEHLLGFIAQRTNKFKKAQRHHLDAIDTVLQGITSLTNLIDKSDKNEIDYQNYSRLLMLLKTLTRAVGNQCVYLRYVGRLLEAVKLTDNNLLIAQLVGTREEQRVKVNRFLFKAMKGDITTADLKGEIIEDPALYYREAFANAIVYTKSINQYYHIINPFANNYTKKSRKKSTYLDYTEGNKLSDEQQENIKISLKTIQDAIQKALNIKKKQEIVTILLEKTGELPFSATREIADLYYLYGKTVFATQLALEKDDYLQEAEIALKNAMIVAEKAQFKYLTMECSEALYRLTYFVENITDAEVYKKQFNTEWTKHSDNQEDEGLYHDLRAKFKLTEGDVLLKEYIQHYPSINGLEALLTCYHEALLEAHAHNQDRYLLIIRWLAKRLTIIMGYCDTNMTRDFATYIEEFFRRQKDSIITKDNTFVIFIKAMLNVLMLFREVQLVDNKDYKGEFYDEIKADIRKLVGKGKFQKAVEINHILIQILELKSKGSSEQEETKLEFWYRLYQQFYCVSGIQQDAASKAVFQFIEQQRNEAKQENSSIIRAIYHLARGIRFYRDNRLWNLEVLVFEDYATSFSKEKEVEYEKFKNAESDLFACIDDITNCGTLKSYNIMNWCVNYGIDKNVKSRERLLLAEACFRLGELYIFKDASINQIKMQLQDNVPNSESETTELDNYLNKLKEKYYKFATNNSLLTKNDIGTFWNEAFTPKSRLESVSYLCCAAFLAEKGKDLHRESDAFQSAINALYATNYVKYESENLEYCEKRITFLNELNLFVCKELLKSKHDKYLYPIVAAKSFIVSGDTYFSMLFEQIKNSNEQIKEYKLRKSVQQSEHSEPERGFIKASLHRMMWNYLEALNQLTEAVRTYENHHFNNMLLVINERVQSITEPMFLRYIWEDLKAVWNSFANLQDKEDVLNQLILSLKIREAGIRAQKAFALLEPENKNDERS